MIFNSYWIPLSIPKLTFWVHLRKTSFCDERRRVSVNHKSGNFHFSHNFNGLLNPRRIIFQLNDCQNLFSKEALLYKVSYSSPIYIWLRNCAGKNRNRFLKLDLRQMRLCYRFRDLIVLLMNSLFEFWNFFQVFLIGCLNCHYYYKHACFRCFSKILKDAQKRNLTV